MFDTQERLVKIVEKIEKCLKQFATYTNIKGYVLQGALRERVVDYHVEILKFCFIMFRLLQRGRLSTAYLQIAKESND